MPDNEQPTPVDEMESMFLVDATNAVQKLLEDHQGIFQLALVINWRAGISDKERTHCILEGTPNVSKSDDPVKQGMRMYELLLSSGGHMMTQLVIHAVSQLRKAEDTNKKLVADRDMWRDRFNETHPDVGM